MTQLHSQISWVGQHNAELVLKNIEANTMMTDLGARQQALEEELARVTGERDVQRATCLLYTSPSPRDGLLSRMPSSA